MQEIIKISLCAIVGVLLALSFKKDKPQYSFLMGLALGIFVLGYCLNRVNQVMTEFAALREYLGAGGGYLRVLMKVLAITYLCEFSSSTCKDAGYSVLAGQIEILGKLSVMIAGLSILFTVIDQIQALV